MRQTDSQIPMFKVLHIFKVNLKLNIFLPRSKALATVLNLCIYSMRLKLSRGLEYLVPTDTVDTSNLIGAMSVWVGTKNSLTATQGVDQLGTVAYPL